MQVSINGTPKNIVDNNLDGTSITTAQTKDRDTYESLYWDFDNVWTMSPDGYPQLQWLAEATITKGDLNNDGVFDIADIILIIDVMTGETTDELMFAAADVTNNGEVDIADIIATIDLMIEQNNSASARNLAATTDELTNSDHIAAALNGNNLTVNLDNDNEYAGFQMMVTLPEGLQLTEVELNPVRSSAHSVMLRQLTDTQYLVMGFSLSNHLLKGNTGNLLSLTTEGNATGSIVFSDVKFATTDGQVYRLADAVISDATTGVSDIANRISSDSKYYDLQGRRIDSPKLKVQNAKLRKGIYIMNGKKVVMK